ncbi:MAG: hypothetical protein WC048_15505 [Rhizobium sp.]
MSLSRNLLVSALLGLGIIPIHSAAAAQMTNEQIAREIVGKEMTASRNGISVRLRYSPDGTVTIRTMFMSGSGTWKFGADGLCMDMTSGPKRGRTCVSFENLGDKTYRNSEGLVLTVQN